MMSKVFKRDDVPASDMLGDPAFPHHIMNYDTYFQGHNCTWWVILWWWDPNTPLNITFFGNETSWPDDPGTIMLPYSEPGFCYDCFNSTSYGGTCLDRHPESRKHNNKPMYAMEAVLGVGMAFFLLFCAVIMWRLWRSKKVRLTETDEEMIKCQEEVKARDARGIEDESAQAESEKEGTVKIVSQDKDKVDGRRNSRFVEGEDGPAKV